MSYKASFVQHVSIKLAEGIKPELIPSCTKMYIDVAQQIPLDRFLPKPVVQKGLPKPKTPTRLTEGGRGRRGGAINSGRGGSFGSRGGSFAGPRGGAFGRGRGNMNGRGYGGRGNFGGFNRN